MKLLYFASMRQKIGRSEEDFTPSPPVKTVSDLIAALRARGPEYAEAFRNTERLRCAVNQTHVDFNAGIAANDEIAFFPPVTGG
jgi:molybdopterin synthase sulfur carrier subunit